MTDIPEFTIGSGAMNPSVVKVDEVSEEKSSKGSPSKDEEAPFKSLKNNDPYLKVENIDSNRKML